MTLQDVPDVWWPASATRSGGVWRVGEGRPDIVMGRSGGVWRVGEGRPDIVMGRSGGVWRVGEGRPDIVMGRDEPNAGSIVSEIGQKNKKVSSLFIRWCHQQRRRK